VIDESSGTKTPVRKGSLAHLADQDRVLKAAAHLFDRHGYVETTMQDIADRLKISKPTLYKHAKSKSELLQLIINSWIDHSDRVLEEAAQMPDRPARIPSVVRQWTELAVGNSAHLKVFLSDEQDMPPRAIRRYKEWSDKVYGQFRQWIAEGQADGFYRKDADPTVTAFMILGFILLLPRWLKGDGRLSPQQVADEFLKTLQSGLQQRD
jgi:AcrR family transcriptional regulator